MDTKYLEIIKAPLITEKSRSEQEKGKYVFLVSSKATKKEIKEDELNPDLVNCSFDEAIKLRKEALTNIICYSNDNLTKFIISFSIFSL